MQREEAEVQRIRLEELAAEEAALEGEAAQEREAEAANRQAYAEQEAELAAGEARVLALRTALQARRGAPMCLRRPPLPQICWVMQCATRRYVDSSFFPAVQSTGYESFMNPLFSDLAVRYPAINESLFKAISENTMAPINILKLYTKYTPDREKMKVLRVNSTLAVETLEEDALLSEAKGPAHLIQYFLLHCTILLHFILSEIRYDLTISPHAYLDRFLDFTLLYTRDSIKSFHFIFYWAGMSEGIADGMGWSRANTHLESLHLVRKF